MGDFLLIVVGGIVGIGLFFLYHSMVDVTYFGGMGMGILKELMVCFFLGMALTAVLITFLGRIIKWVLIIGLVLGVIYLFNNRGEISDMFKEE